MKNKRLFFHLLFFIFLIFIPGRILAQIVYEPVTNNQVYEYLDEMATMKFIWLNSTVKPYSRQIIAGKLSEIEENKEQLNKRQKNELAFYLKDYALELRVKSDSSLLTPHSSLRFDPMSFNYSNRWLRMSILPVLGTDFVANENGTAGTVTGGGNIFGYVGKRWGVYASVVQRFQNVALVKAEYFTLKNGYDWKTRSNGNVVNTEFTGGLTYSWTWGEIGVYRDRFVWGNGVHGANIFSGRTPPFPFVRFHLKPAKWIEFFYIHGWLKSNIIDSMNFQEHKGSGIHYLNKFIAANIVTFTPWKGLGISLGNSAVYSSDNIQPAYLIPFLFYPAVGATLSLDNDVQDNYQMFFEISSRNLRHLQVFVTLYIDEFKISRVTDPNTYNFLSWKGGLRIWDFPVQNLSFTAEFYQSNAGTYQHFIPALEYTSDDYCLGDYLRENSLEIFASLAYKPFRGLIVSTWFNRSVHGEDTQYGIELYPDKIKPLENPTWKNTSFGLGASYEFINHGTISIQYEYNDHHGNMARLPELFRGKTNSFTISLGLGI